MSDFLIGDIIREERIKHGMSQEQLCEGICEIPTLSRIENGKQYPKRELQEKLLSKLDLVASRYYGLSNRDELEMEELKLEIKDANARLDFAEALRLLGEFELKFADNKNPIYRQFILWTRAINGYMQNGERMEHSADRKLEMLLEAIHCTVPSIDLDNIQGSWLTLDDLLVILSIANYYCDNGRSLKAISLYAQLLKYAQTKLRKVTEDAQTIPLITYNYSRAMGREKYSKEELEIAQIGIDCCARYGKSRLYGELLINKSCALQRLGRTDEAKHWAIRSYYMVEALDSGNQLEVITEYMLNTYNWTPED